MNSGLNGIYRRTPLWWWQEVKDEATTLIVEGVSPHDALGLAEQIVVRRHGDPRGLT